MLIIASSGFLFNCYTVILRLNVSITALQPIYYQTLEEKYTTLKLLLLFAEERVLHLCQTKGF